MILVVHLGHGTLQQPVLLAVSFWSKSVSGGGGGLIEPRRKKNVVRSAPLS